MQRLSNATDKVCSDERIYRSIIERVRAARIIDRKRLQLFIEINGLPPLRAPGQTEKVIVKPVPNASCLTSSATQYILIDTMNVGYKGAEDFHMPRLQSCRAVLRCRYPDAILVWFIYGARLMTPGVKDALRELTWADKTVIVPLGADCDTAMLAFAVFVGAVGALLMFVTNDRFRDHSDFLRRVAPTRSEGVAAGRVACTSSSFVLRCDELSSVGGVRLSSPYLIATFSIVGSLESTGRDEEQLATWLS